MSSTNGGPGEANVPAAPSLNVLGQYIKDFSFENPNAPQSLMQLTKPPAINIQINVNAKPLSNTDFEVELVIEGKAENEGALLFNVELTYAGIFRVQNVPQESVHPMVLIECPRLLFPFARGIVSDAVRDGGYPPMMLDPVDFAALYRQRAGQLQGQPPQAVTR
ncbi:MAG TPA: protein-export chaperone SecB [Xanthobacteraceae bacterium]|jgi:preprotein translocase subunit SecB